ncbi:type II secretion system F family protein [Nocardioides sp. CER19]|uniref:type II secretion system F family protein n=1 Tax=Nocardioides sp. CER19 TaxID=3038538 RepID=UPI00244BCE36|nr:type II secretion system F family protein [Nocardioides sp. CER19]MDH2413234.1 type II secretion system F family protein [Nocardioides sp. CER19]
MAVSDDLLLAIACGLVVGAGLFVAVLAIVGLPERNPGKPRRQRASLQERTRRLVVGVVAGVLTLLLSRWIVAAVGIGLLVAFWDRIAGSSGVEKRAIARLEALAGWTESLRDTIAGAIGLEQAIPATAVNAGAPIRPSLNLLVDRLRIREPLPDALRAFAEDLDDPSADIICAALLLNARLRGPGLRDVLTALAQSTREELDMRRRIEASRKAIRRSVRIVLFIVLGMMGGLTLLNRQYVEPFDSLVGQLVLVVVVALFAAGLLWLRSLSAPSKVDRFLVFGQEADALPVEVAS